MESSVVSVSRERFWKKDFKRFVEAGEKRCSNFLTGEGGGVCRSGSEMVIKEESSEASSG